MTPKIYAKPTKSGNGFEQNKIYEFVKIPTAFNQYTTLNSNGHERVVGLDTLVKGLECVHLQQGALNTKRSEWGVWEITSVETAA
jgi:hypothetical protein